MSTYFRAVSRSGRRCPRLRCGELGSGCPAGTSPVFSTDDAGCPVCTCRQLVDFLRPSTTCAPLDCSHLVCVGPVRFSSRLVGRCPICECVPIDDEAAGSAAPATSPSCPELDCPDHFRCQGGRKRDERTGCATCECADDDCADCTAACAGSEPTRCAAVCGCGVGDAPPCRPLPIDCELRRGCFLTTDADGCEICRCAAAEASPTNTPSPVSVCPQMTCPLTCAGTGYAVDDNGCRACACAVEEAETTTTTTTTTASATASAAASITTSCGPADCATQCPAEFDVVKGDDGCDACVCMEPETVSDGEVDVAEPSAEAGRRSGENDDATTAARCAHVTRDDCEADCEVATDDAGCQFCLCEDRAPDREATDSPTTTTTTVVDREVDEATTKSEHDACQREFVCHPICEAIADERGCVVECRCDDVVAGLADMQQQEQQPDYESPAVICPTSDDVCSCDDDEEERRTVGDDGCPTCVCVTSSSTTSAPPTTTSPTTTDTTTTTTASRQEGTTTAKEETESTSTVMATTSRRVIVECRPLSDGDCANVTCGDGGHAKDKDGCEVCACESTEKEEPAKTVHHVVASARKGTCSLSPLRGPCRATITRWYYDVISGSCETFSYGGCRGNANNFRSPESCRRYCRPLVDEKQHQSRMWYQRVLGLLR